MKQFLAILLCLATLRAAAVEAVRPVLLSGQVWPVAVARLICLLDAAAPPEQLRAVVAELTSRQLAAVLPLLSPEQLRAVVAELTSRQLAAVLPLLSPEQLRAVVATLSPTAWEGVSEWLASEPAPTSRPHSSNWIEASKERLRQRVAREGFTPEILAEVQQLMQKAKTD